MNKEEKQLKENLIYNGKIIKLYNDDVICPNGIKTTREYIVHPGGVCILPIIGEYVLLIKQFRYAYRKELYELPAGKLEKGEAPLEAAKRELEEETGVRLSKIQQIGAYSKVDRDPRGRTVTVAYLAIVDEPIAVTGQDDAAKAEWWPLSDLPHLAFDHYDIMQDAIALYKAKLNNA